ADAGFEATSLQDPALNVHVSPAGREVFTLFYTASGSTPKTTIGAAASYDGERFSRVGRQVLSDPAANLRAGSLDIVDDRTAPLWVGRGMGGNASIGPGIAPPGARTGSRP